MTPPASGHHAATASRWLLAALLTASALLSGCKAELFGRIDEADANAALDALYSEGIVASKSPAGDNQWRVEVDEKDHQRALQVARNHGVPRERFVSMGELFKKEGLVSTPSEIRMRYLYAVSQELSNTLSQIDGVISARVHPVIPVNDPLADKVQPSSAAVFIKHLPDADLRQMAPAIKTLVTRSIEGLKVEHVSLTFFASRAQPKLVPVQQTALLAGLLPGDPVVSSLAVLLACCLAVTWAVLGWRLWRRPSKPQPAAASMAPAVRVHGAPPFFEADGRPRSRAPAAAAGTALDAWSVSGDATPRFDAARTEDVAVRTQPAATH